MNQKKAAVVITKFFKKIKKCCIDFEPIPFNRIFFTDHGAYNIKNLLIWSEKCYENNHLPSYPCTRKNITPIFLFLLLAKEGISINKIKDTFIRVKQSYQQVKNNKLFESLKNYLFLNSFHLKAFLFILILDFMNLPQTTEYKHLICNLIIVALSIDFPELIFILH